MLLHPSRQRFEPTHEPERRRPQLGTPVELAGCTHTSKLYSSIASRSNVIPAAVLAPGLAGTEEVLGQLEGSPFLAVPLDEGDDVQGPIPPWLAAVVVGVTNRLPSGAAPADVDIALMPCTGADAPPGWVAVTDVGSELERLRAQVDRSPLAAVALAQALRIGDGLPVHNALVVESLVYSMLQTGPEFKSWLSTRERREPPPDERGPAVIVVRRGDELLLTLNRPRVRNALNTRLRDELCEGLTIACADQSIRAVHLSGAGPDFSSGGDLNEFGQFPDPITGHFTRTTRSPGRLIAMIADRVVVHVQGTCVGGGLELAAFANHILATPDARFQLPEVAMGIIPGAGGTVSISRRIGRQRTAWLGLGAAFIDAVQAERWGLIDEIDL